MSELPEYTLDREFDAPRELVWRAWTDPELLARWYGPNVETIIHGFDLRPGGCFAEMMAGMDGGWGKGYAILDGLLAELRQAGN